MTQLEVYKSFQFVAELMLAELLYVYPLARRKHFVWRLLGVMVACFGFSYLIPAKIDNAFYLAFLFFAIFAFMTLMLKVLFKEKWLTIVFCSIAGYTTQHLAYELYNLFTVASNVSPNTPMGFYGSEFTNMFSNFFVLICYFFIYLMTYFLCFAFFGDKLKKQLPIQLKGSSIFAFIIIILTIDVVLNAIVVYYFAGHDDRLYLIIVGIYNILCCIIALYLQFEVAIRKNLETTLDTMQQIWHQEQEQYEQSKENIALINMKCHDLKHQIRHLRDGNEVNESTLREIEQSISIYDSTVKTGNEALDTILTEKSLFCNRNNVNFTCIIDGEKLSFISEQDIYSLFGNIVDNAIEAVLKLEPEKRVISLKVKETNGMLMVKESNYYDANLFFVDGMPVTTKEDKKYHGFGTKSIRYVSEKYGGDISFSTEGPVFTVTILFLMDKDQNED